MWKAKLVSIHAQMECGRIILLKSVKFARFHAPLVKIQLISNAVVVLMSLWIYYQILHVNAKILLYF